MVLPPSWHQHSTDEAQKAETVLSAVIYIFIYLYTYGFYSQRVDKSRTSELTVK